MKHKLEMGKDDMRAYQLGICVKAHQRSEEGMNINNGSWYGDMVMNGYDHVGELSDHLEIIMKMMDVLCYYTGMLNRTVLEAI